MAKKTTLSHMTADGKVHTRTTARTYSHVIVATLAMNPTKEEFFKARGLTSAVLSWVGRPDLIPGAVRENQKYGFLHLHPEPINNGTRA